MKRILLGLLSSLLVGFSGAQMLPDSVEHFQQNGPSYQTIPFKTKVYTYNPNGLVIEEKTFLLREPGERFTYTYLDGRLVEKQLDWYNQDGDFKWTPRTKWTTFYNAAGLDTGFVEYTFQKSKNDWEIRMSYLYALKMDSQNRIVDQLTLRINENLNSLDTSYRLVYTYQDSDNLPDSLTHFSWVDGAWSAGECYSQLKWEKGFDYRVFEFNPTSKKVYSLSDGVWELSSYDSSVFIDGSMLERYFFTKNMYDSLALYFSRMYDYDGVGNRISYKEYFYDYNVDPNGIRVNGNSEESSYTYNGTTNDILEEIRTTTNSNGWESRSKILYHYPSRLNGIRVFQPDKRIYPNPVFSSQRLSVENFEEVKKLELYSSEGKLLRSWNEMDEQGIDIQGFAAGIYFIRLVDREGNVTTQRLLIN